MTMNQDATAESDETLDALQRAARGWSRRDDPLNWLILVVILVVISVIAILAPVDSAALASIAVLAGVALIAVALQIRRATTDYPAIVDDLLSRYQPRSELAVRTLRERTSRQGLTPAAVVRFVESEREALAGEHHQRLKFMQTP